MCQVSSHQRLTFPPHYAGYTQKSIHEIGGAKILCSISPFQLWIYTPNLGAEHRQRLTWIIYDDPIDICDLSQTKKQLGSIYRGKIMGSFCLIDQGEIDWKIIMIDENQAKHNKINDINHFPKAHIRAVMDWFKDIKVFDGKKANSIAYDEKIFSRDETLAIISQTHEDWKKLNNSTDSAYNQIRKNYYLHKIIS